MDIISREAGKFLMPSVKSVKMYHARAMILIRKVPIPTCHKLMNAVQRDVFGGRHHRAGINITALVYKIENAVGGGAQIHPTDTLIQYGYENGRIWHTIDGPGNSITVRYVLRTSRQTGANGCRDYTHHHNTASFHR